MASVQFTRGSVLRLLHDYLVESNLFASARVLELEAGVPPPESNEVRGALATALSPPGSSAAARRARPCFTPAPRPLPFSPSART
jgi:hypothetical protein